MYRLSFHGLFGRAGAPPQPWLEELAVAAGAEITEADAVSESPHSVHVSLCAEEPLEQANAASWHWLVECVLAHEVKPLGGLHGHHAAKRTTASG
jgi:hypothetical protein